MNNNNRSHGSIARLALVLVLLGIMAVGLAACGGTEATPTPTVSSATGVGGNTGSTGSTNGSTPTTVSQGSSGSSSGSGSAQEVKATLNEWSVSLNVDQVNAGQVKFLVTNEGQNSHDLSVLDSSGTSIGTTPTFKKDDGTKELTVDLKPGVYTVVCDVPGHTEKGMKTSLTVK